MVGVHPVTWQCTKVHCHERAVVFQINFGLYCFLEKKEVSETCSIVFSTQLTPTALPPLF